MPLVAVSTVIREVPVGEPSGYLRIVDLDGPRIAFCGVVPESIHRRDDPNPRGGTRGAKGVAVCPNRCAVAIADRVAVFDGAWTLRAELTHPWFGQIHGIMVEPDGVWVTAAACDLLARVDWSGSVTDSWSPRSDPALQEALGVAPLPPFEPSRDYRDPLTTGGGFDTVHLNAVSPAREGLLLSLGMVRDRRALARNRRELGLIRALERTKATRALLRRVRRRRLANPPDHTPDGRPLPHNSFALVELRDLGAGPDQARARLLHRRDGVGFPNHDVCEAGELIVYNDTNANQLVAIDRSGAEHSRVPLTGSPPFARGLARLADDLFLSGNQAPAVLNLVDIGSGRLVSSMPLGGQPTESVAAIAVLPEGVPAPESLPGFEPGLVTLTA